MELILCFTVDVALFYYKCNHSFLVESYSYLQLHARYCVENVVFSCVENFVLCII